VKTEVTADRNGISDSTKAVVAICVVFVAAAAVGAVGTPVNAGEAFGARLDSNVPESETLPRPSEVMTSPDGAEWTPEVAVAAVVVLPEPETLIVPVVVIGPPVASPDVAIDVTPEPLETDSFPVGVPIHNSLVSSCQYNCPSAKVGMSAAGPRKFWNVKYNAIITLSRSQARPVSPWANCSQSQ